MEYSLFALAQILLLVGIVITIYQSALVLPPEGWRNYSTEIFFCLNTLLIGAAFAFHFKRQKDLQSTQLELTREKAIREAQLREEDMRHHLNRTQHFAHVISHNLRSPVASLLGLIDLIQHTGPRPELIAKTSNITKSMDHKLRELNEILKIESTDLPKEKVDCKPILEEIAREVVPQLKWKQLQIKWDLEPKTSVWGVHSLLHSIFLNLIENAIKYSTKESQFITIRSKTKENHICFEIIDKGLGIDLDRYQHRLFKLYERLHPEVEGTGKGLYLCQVHVDQMNGRIEVDSKVGEGSTFRVWLHLYSNQL